MTLSFPCQDEVLLSSQHVRKPSVMRNKRRMKKMKKLINFELKQNKKTIEEKHNFIENEVHYKVKIDKAIYRRIKWTKS